MTDVEIAIATPCPLWADAVPGVEGLCRTAAGRALAEAGNGLAGAVELSLVLADDEVVRQLNRQYRGQDKPTNVLSFAALDDADAPTPTDGPLLLGDVILAFQTTAAEAAADDKTIGDHLAHLVVHGVLHLLGYDHDDDAEAALMEGRERLILAGLGIADPYQISKSDAAKERDTPT
jgi:probable rRNA maturation factor